MRIKGLICAFSGASLWGLSSVFSDFLMSNYEVSPLFLVMVRALCASVLFLAAIVASDIEKVRAVLADRASMRSIAVFGVAGLFLCQMTYILTINWTNAGTATVMQSLNIVFVPLATWAMRKAKLSWNEIAGAFLAFFAVLIIATQGDIRTLSMPLMGLIWGLACGVATSIYVMYPVRLFEKWGSFIPTGLGMAVGALAATVIWLVAACADGSLAKGTAFPHLDGAGIAALAGVCILGTFVAFALFLRGVHLVGSVTTTLLGAAEPAVAAGLSAVWLHTPFTGWDWLGLALMLATIVLVALKGISPERADA